VDRQYPKFYASVRPYTLQMEKQAPAIVRYLDRYCELYPVARFPPVYFVIGSLGPDVDTSEIDPPSPRHGDRREYSTYRRA
jgi:hypothetical protein